MYDPWYPTDSSTADIIKLIEEKERKEAYVEETSKWDIMRMRDVSANEKPKTSHYLEHYPSTRPGRSEHGKRSVSTADASRSRGVEPLKKQLRPAIDAVNRRSNSPKDSKRSKRRQKSPDPKLKHDRSRSVSGDRKRRRVRSRSRESKRDRSRSPEKRHHRSVSPDKKNKKSDRQRSGSHDIVQRDPSSSVITEILSQVVSVLNDVKEKLAQNDKKEVPKHNVLPEFDPNNKGHAMVTWLIRVDDVAKLFGWSEKETLQHSLPKLVGDAKTWYQTLTSVPFSWNEWKKTLLEQYPCPDFTELLMEMSNRCALPTETLEQYFFAKMTLLNRCGFKGRQAVDCLLQGIETDAIRLCARAAHFAEPEELLVYLKSSESLRQTTKSNTEPLPPETTNTTTTTTANTVQEKSKEIIKKRLTCFKCRVKGHVALNCTKNVQQATMIRPPGVKTTHAQVRMKNNQQLRGPRPTGPNKYPEHEYIKPPFAKKCYICKQFGHTAPLCRLLTKLNQAGEGAAGGPSQDGLSQDGFSQDGFPQHGPSQDGSSQYGPSQDRADQPAPPGIEDNS